MKNFLFKPYSLHESVRFRTIILVGGGVFSFLFLYIFEPFGIHRIGGADKFLTISLYSSFGTIAMFLQFFVLQPYVLKRHTVLSTILWLLLSVAMVGATSTIVHAFLFNNGVLHFLSFIVFLGIVFSINILPTTLIVILHYNYLTTKRLKTTLEINKRLLQKNAVTNNDNQLILRSQNKNNDLILNASQLYYMVATDNYVNIFYSENSDIKHVLVRNTLSAIKQDLISCESIMRCHKSYIVNKDKIISVEGNAAGYKLQLANISESIPISRSLNKEIAHWIT